MFDNKYFMVQKNKVFIERVSTFLAHITRRLFYGMQKNIAFFILYKKLQINSFDKKKSANHPVCRLERMMVCLITALIYDNFLITYPVTYS